MEANSDLKVSGVSFIPKKPNCKNYLPGLHLGSQASGLNIDC